MANHVWGGWLPVLGASLLTAACATAPAAKPPAHRLPSSASSTSTAMPATSSTLYGADDALRDVLSSPLEYVGTGAWPSNNRVHACVYRNQRVLVVNVYCTLTELHAFRVDVYSPERGRARIYAEAKGVFSGNMRQQYFSFNVESDPVPPAEAQLPKVTLGMSFAQLSGYEQQRYDAYLPSCFSGQEHNQKREGCLGTLAPRSQGFSARNRSFLERASDDWYRTVRTLRALATQHGREPND